jgi:zinc-ribbon domain
MDIGSIFLILALLIPVVLYISRPLFDRRETAVSPSVRDISTLLAERDQVISTLHELDDDYNLGKIPTENYPVQRQTLLQNGAEILRQIDAFQPASNGGSAEDRLEAAIVARRSIVDGIPVRKNGTAVPPVPDDDIEQKIALRRRNRQGRAGGFCPKCGRPVQALDHFCPKCGATLA